MNNLCPVESRATRPSIVPFLNGHEIQQRQQVSESRTSEVVVQNKSGSATVLSCGSQRQLLQQQSPQCQLQLQRVKSVRNGFIPQAFNASKKTHKNLFQKVCEYDNLLLAYKKAKKRKSKKQYVIDFEKNLNKELSKLQWELLTGTYKPRKLKSFVIRDPKTRKISSSNFRDRVVHHAICNLLNPIFEPRLINDTFANRKNKGTSATLRRFDYFRRKYTHGFILKADIKHYFENIDHKILISILKKRIKDKEMLELIATILNNYSSKGMPLGNLTSQFFANIYLSELDYFVKHKLHAKHYIRYVDDFVILSKSPTQLETWKCEIEKFLSNNLNIELHPQKTKIFSLANGVPLVGFRIFEKHKLLKKSNQRRIFRRINLLKCEEPDKLRLRLAGWEGYAKMANTFKLRHKVRELIQNVK